MQMDGARKAPFFLPISTTGTDPFSRPPALAHDVFIRSMGNITNGNLREDSSMTVSTERAVLAGGCFWGMQDLIRKYPGVITTRVGYTGGDIPNATYRKHGTHAEAIEITFDPSKISYRKLLEFFFQIHDPTTRNRQGNDIGASYRSAIFFTNEEQKRVALDTIADVDASGLWPGKVVTEVVPAGPFWEAEPEHQDYLENYPNGYTCHFVRPGWVLPKRETSGPRNASASVATEAHP
jgi:peptide-methionine (S)-S-oxide reductase